MRKQPWILDDMEKAAHVPYAGDKPDARRYMQDEKGIFFGPSMLG